MFATWFACNGPSVHGWFCDRRIDRQLQRTELLKSANLRAAAPIWAAIDRRLVDRAAWVPMVNDLGLGGHACGLALFRAGWDFVTRAESQTSAGALRRANGRWRHSRPRSAAARSEAVSPTTRRRTPGGRAGRRGRRIRAHLRLHRRVPDRRRDSPARGGVRAVHAGGSGACRRSVAVSRMLSRLQCNQPDAFARGRKRARSRSERFQV
jgi:hypothetical protein